jgi:flagellar assembly protein FliH
MSANRVIPARKVDYDSIESFPYFAAQFAPSMDEDEDGDDNPLSANLSTPEEDANRLASVDQIIYQKMQQAERDAHDVARKAYEEGFASGEGEGRVFGESQYKAQIQRLDGALRELSASLALNEKASQEELLALAMAMAEYLAGREIEQGVQTIRPLLTAVLEAHPFPEGDTPGRAAVTVLINPRDLEELGDAAREHAGVVLREDEALSRGSLRVESAAGVLDATLERRRARLLELIQRTQEKEAL